MQPLQELNDYANTFVFTEDERPFEITYLDDSPANANVNITEGDQHTVPITIDVGSMQSVPSNGVTYTIQFDNDGSTLLSGNGVVGLFNGNVVNTFNQIDDWTYQANLVTILNWPVSANIIPPDNTTGFGYTVTFAHPEYPANSNVTGYSWHVDVSVNDLDEWTTPVSPVDYDEDYPVSPVPGYPQITDLENPNSTTYTVEIYASDSNALANISSTGTGNIVTDWGNSNANAYTMVGNKDEINADLSNLTVWPATDYVSDFTLFYKQTGLANLVTTVNQSWQINVLNSETSNLGIDRNYYSNQKNLIYNNEDPNAYVPFSWAANTVAANTLVVTGDYANGYTYSGNGAHYSLNAVGGNVAMMATLDNTGAFKNFGFISSAGNWSSGPKIFFFTDAGNVLTSRIDATDVVIASPYTGGDTIGIERHGEAWEMYYNGNLVRTGGSGANANITAPLVGIQLVDDTISNVKFYDADHGTGNISANVPQIIEGDVGQIYTIRLTLGNNYGEIHPVGVSTNWYSGNLTYQFIGNKDECNRMLASIIFQPNKDEYSNTTVQYRQFRGNVLQTNDTVNYYGNYDPTKDDIIYNFTTATSGATAFNIDANVLINANSQLLVVGGGGAGGVSHYIGGGSNFYLGGGGGGGGVIYEENYPPLHALGNVIGSGNVQMQYRVGAGGNSQTYAELTTGTSPPFGLTYYYGQTSYLRANASALTGGFGNTYYYSASAPGGGYGGMGQSGTLTLASAEGGDLSFGGNGGSGGGGSLHWTGGGYTGYAGGQSTHITQNGGSVPDPWFSGYTHPDFLGGLGGAALPAAVAAAGGGGGAPDNGDYGSPNVNSGGYGSGYVSNITGTPTEYARGGRAGIAISGSYGTGQFTTRGSGGDAGFDFTTGGSEGTQQHGANGITGLVYLKFTYYDGPQ